jgi:hypothetical protein
MASPDILALRARGVRAALAILLGGSKIITLAAFASAGERDGVF